MAPVNLVIRGCALHPELTIIILWCMRSIQNWISIKKRIRLAWKKVCRDIFLPRVILWVYIKKPNNKAHTSAGSYFGRLILRQAHTSAGSYFGRLILRQAHTSAGSYFGRLILRQAHTSAGTYFGRLILRQAQYNKEDTKAKAIQKN